MAKRRATSICLLLPAVHGLDLARLYYFEQSLVLFSEAAAQKAVVSYTALLLPEAAAERPEASRSLYQPGQAVKKPVAVNRLCLTV